MLARIGVPNRFLQTVRLDGVSREPLSRAAARGGSAATDYAAIAGFASPASRHAIRRDSQARGRIYPVRGISVIHLSMVYGGPMV
jgi:hypothetical protein